MKINGKDIGLKYTVRAQRDIAALCADRKFKNIGQLFSEDMPNEELIKNMFDVARILNNAFEQSTRHQKGEPVDVDADYSVITFDEFLDLDVIDEQRFETEIFATIAGGNKRAVEAQAPKGKKNEKVQASK